MPQRKYGMLISMKRVVLIVGMVFIGVSVTTITLARHPFKINPCEGRGSSFGSKCRVPQTGGPGICGYANYKGQEKTLTCMLMLYQRSPTTPIWKKSLPDCITPSPVKPTPRDEPPSGTGGSLCDPYIEIDGKRVPCRNFFRWGEKGGGEVYQKCLRDAVPCDDTPPKQ